MDNAGPLPAGDLQRLAAGTVTALTAIHGDAMPARAGRPAGRELVPGAVRAVSTDTLN